MYNTDKYFNTESYYENKTSSASGIDEVVKKILTKERRKNEERSDSANVGSNKDVQPIAEKVVPDLGTVADSLGDAVLNDVPPGSSTTSSSASASSGKGAYSGASSSSSSTPNPIEHYIGEFIYRFKESTITDPADPIYKGIVKAKNMIFGDGKGSNMDRLLLDGVVVITYIAVSDAVRSAKSRKK